MQVSTVEEVALLEARRFVRKLRGGSQSHLIEASDGRHYAVKFRNNPQGRRVLVNEWLSSAVFSYLRISSPQKAIVQVTPSFLAGNPDVSLRLSDDIVTPATGAHFGSAYPGDPEQLAIYDYLPDQTLKNLVNCHDFWGALVVDRWMGNSDVRQCVFIRDRIRKWAPSVPVHGSRTGFVAIMIDNGYAFNGSLWSFKDLPTGGLYPRHAVYEHIRGVQSFEPWLEQVFYFPEKVLTKARKEIPTSWLDDGDTQELDMLIETLLKRRRIIQQLLLKSRLANQPAFPAWR